MQTNNGALSYPKPRAETLNLVERFGSNFTGDALVSATEMFVQTDMRRKLLANMLSSNSSSPLDIRYHMGVESCAAQYVVRWLEVVRVMSSSAAITKAPPAQKGVHAQSGLFYQWFGSPSLRIAERHGEELADTSMRFETIMAFVVWGIACVNYATMVERDPRSTDSQKNMEIARDSFARASNCFEMARRELRQFRFAPKAFGTLAELNDTVLNAMFQWSLCGYSRSCMRISEIQYLQGDTEFDKQSEWVKFVMRGHWGVAAYATDAFEAAQQMGGTIPKSEVAEVTAAARQEHMAMVLQYKARLVLQQQTERESVHMDPLGLDRHEPMTSAYHFLNMSDYFVQYARDTLAQPAFERIRTRVTHTCDTISKANETLRQAIRDANMGSITPCVLPSAESSFNNLPQLQNMFGDDEQPQYLYEDFLTEDLVTFRKETGLLGTLKDSGAIQERASITALPAIVQVPYLDTTRDGGGQSKAQQPTQATAAVSRPSLVPPVIFTNPTPKPAARQPPVAVAKPAPRVAQQTVPQTRIVASPTVVVESVIVGSDDEDEWPEDEDPDAVLAMYLPNPPTQAPQEAPEPKVVVKHKELTSPLSI